MKFLFKKCFNWFEFACIIGVGPLLSVSWWWLLLCFPVVLLNVVGETYCEIKEETK